MTVDLSVVVVNYRSADYTAGLVDSVLNDVFLIDGRRGTVEITIVDNASRGDDLTRLQGLVGPGVRLVRNTENVGYALANNQGFAVSRGRFHLVINPDARVTRGALGTMIEALETLPGAGIVGPTISMDLDGEALLPPNEMPDPMREQLVALGRYSDGVACWEARRRARFAHRIWTAREPLAVEMLSGGCFMARRSEFEALGLFDPAYPLYYEDTDLFRRFRSRGRTLWHVPGARITHFFSRSAFTRMKAAMYRHELSARRLFTHWFGDAGFRVREAGRARAQRLSRDHVVPWPQIEVAASPVSPTVEIPAVSGVFVELAAHPRFSLTVGLFPKTPGPFTIPESFFGELGPAHYWMRAVDPATGDTLVSWRITKSMPG